MKENNGSVDTSKRVRVVMCVSGGEGVCWGEGCVCACVGVCVRRW